MVQISKIERLSLVKSDLLILREETETFLYFSLPPPSLSFFLLEKASAKLLIVEMYNKSLE